MGHAHFLATFIHFLGFARVYLAKPFLPNFNTEKPIGFCENDNILEFISKYWLKILALLFCPMGGSATYFANNMPNIMCYLIAAPSPARRASSAL